MPNDFRGSVFHSMTQERFNELRQANGGVLPPEFANSFINTDAEDINLDCLRTKILWTNPNPTSTFSAQPITLSSNDYDFLLVFYYTNTTDNTMLSTICERGNRFELSRAVAYGSGYYILNNNRDCDWVSDTRYNIGNASVAWINESGNVERVSVNNGDLIPVSIYGIKKSPAMVYTGAELYEGKGIKIENGVISSEHPVGSYHICATGSEDPAVKFGGTWTQIATNVILPLGNNAPVYTTSSNSPVIAHNQFRLRGIWGDMPSVPRYLAIGTDGGVRSNYQTNWGEGGTDFVPANLSASLANAENALYVDVWLRED